MPLQTATLLDILLSHAKELGVFEHVMLHEPRNAPAQGLTIAFWASSLVPVTSSAIDNTTVRFEVTANVYRSMLADPYDAIDKNMLDAVDKLFIAYCANFSMDNIAREIDLLGQFGVPLSVRGGYVTIGSQPQRAMSITIPIIIDDLYPQIP